MSIREKRRANREVVYEVRVYIDHKRRPSRECKTREDAEYYERLWTSLREREKFEQKTLPREIAKDWGYIYGIDERCLKKMKQALSRTQERW